MVKINVVVQFAYMTRVISGHAKVSQLTEHESKHSFWNLGIFYQVFSLLTYLKIVMLSSAVRMSGLYLGILVPVRTSFGLRWRGGKTYNVST